MTQNSWLYILYTVLSILFFSQNVSFTVELYKMYLSGPKMMINKCIGHENAVIATFILCSEKLLRQVPVLSPYLHWEMIGVM